MSRPPLPELDETIERLSEPERALVAQLSARRAALELEGAAAFAEVTQALIELQADASVVELSARAIVEELEHAEIYRLLACRYGRMELARPRPHAIEIPSFPALDRRQQRILQVVSMCCINETMACAFLESCWRAAEGALMREGIRRVLADEVKHAQIGWALLGSTVPSAEDRACIASFVQPMLAMQLARWSQHIAELPAHALPAHGCLAPATIRELMHHAVDALVLPGFARLGIARPS
jgi:hypothetical protein